jgi:hypothetical protein
MIMPAVSLSSPSEILAPLVSSTGLPAKPKEVTHYIAAGTVLVGGVLLATGHRRAGLAVAATGAALALVEEREAVEAWWHNLPGYLKEAQSMLEKVEGYMNEAITQGHKLQSMFRR